MSKEEEYKSTVRILIEFLEDNEQYGDDWSKQKDDLKDLFTEFKRLREEITALNKWAGNVREFFGDEAMVDLYDIYGDD
jgi:hypothetical protein